MFLSLYDFWRIILDIRQDLAELNANYLFFPFVANQEAIFFHPSCFIHLPKSSFFLYSKTQCYYITCTESKIDSLILTTECIKETFRNPTYKKYFYS